jgi:hypothetical protein
VSPLDLGGIVSLGAFHGLNPAMGWLFAVALGAQEGSRRALWLALPPIALGHAVSIAVTLLVVEEARLVVPQGAVRIAGAVALAGFAVWKLVRARHPRWVGFRVRRRERVLWSLLMSSAHGAGLMLLPFAVGGAGGLGFVAEATSVHTLAFIAVAGAAAVAVYEIFGLNVLRRAWVNLDRLWAYVLLAGAATTLLLG